MEGERETLQALIDERYIHGISSSSMHKYECSWFSHNNKSKFIKLGEVEVVYNGLLHNGFHDVNGIWLELYFYQRFSQSSKYPILLVVNKFMIDLILSTLYCTMH